jgi:hypothetical protein
MSGKPGAAGPVREHPQGGRPWSSGSCFRLALQVVAAIYCLPDTIDPRGPKGK